MQVYHRFRELHWPMGLEKDILSNIAAYFSIKMLEALFEQYVD